jgi:peroxiredoxin
MSSSMRHKQSSADEYKDLVGFDLSTINMDVLITDEKGTRTANLAKELKNTMALVITQPGASTAEEAAKWLPTNWASIPGAGGCGAQVEGFRDALEKFNNRKIYVLNTKLNHADVIAEKKLGGKITFIHACPELIKAMNLQSEAFSFTAIDPKLNAEKTYLRRVNFVIDNGVITAAYTTQNPKQNADEMLCQLTQEQKHENSYGNISPRLYTTSKPLSVSATATPTNTPVVSPRQTL